MRILHLIGSFDKKLGGTYSAILSIMSIENQLGHHNEVLSLLSENQEYDDSLLQNRVMLFVPSFPYKFSYCKAAQNWLGRNIENYDLIILHEIWSALIIQASMLAYKRGVPYVIWPHGSLDPFDLKKKKWLKKLAGPLFISNITQKASALCCTSALEEDLVQTYNKDNNNICVLPLPIDYDNKGDRSLFRKKHFIADDKLVFLFLSRVDYKKGLDLFLYAYKDFLTNTQSVDTKLLIAGKGNRAYEQYIRQIIYDLNLEAHVILSGFLTGSAKDDAYAGSDCFVLPSMNENYGISVVEALQSNLPVLISDNVYIWKNIIPEGGWVCKHEVKSIAQQIDLIYTAFKDQTILSKDPVKASESFRKKNLINSYKSFYQEIFSQASENIFIQPQATV